MPGLPILTATGRASIEMYALPAAPSGDMTASGLSAIEMYGLPVAVDGFLSATRLASVELYTLPSLVSQASADGSCSIEIMAQPALFKPRSRPAGHSPREHVVGKGR